MNKFDYEEKEEEIEELLRDIFYVKGISNRSKISSVRIYSELIIRKLLDISIDEYLTLGDKENKSKLIKLTDNDDFLINTIESLRKKGNDASHSQNLKIFNENEYEEVLLNLLKLQSYLFVYYFKKYKFGKSNRVMEVFSILPPKLRKIILNKLYSIDDKNISVCDKLCLSILKTEGKEKSLEWIERNKNNLILLECVTEQFKKEILDLYGKEYLKAILDNAPENMYICCIDKINEVANQLEKEGIAYETYEQAKSLYLKEGFIDEETDEIKEFNSIMKFIYLGRNAENNERLDNIDRYMIIKTVDNLRGKE